MEHNQNSNGPKLGQVIVGLVIDENKTHYLVQRHGVTYQLSKEEGTFQLGDRVEGFIYRNQKNKLIITTTLPKVRQGHYAFCTVTGVRRDLGVFVDIGLKDKDLLVSMDEMPAMGELWPKVGDHLMVTLTCDDKDRLWGTLATEAIVKGITRRGTKRDLNRNVTGIVIRNKMVGTFVLTTDYQLGFIHPSERFMEPRLGETIKARVVGIGHDSMLNLSMKPRTHEVIDDDAQMILMFLNRSATGSIPYSDKSTPEEIQAKFAISKAQFKRALGRLMKEKKIYQKDGVTYLIKEDGQDDK